MSSIDIVRAFYEDLGRGDVPAAMGLLASEIECGAVRWFIGERAVVFLTTDRRRWIFLGAVVLAFVTLIAYRLWRRHRFGRAQTATVENIGQDS